MAGIAVAGVDFTDAGGFTGDFDVNGETDVVSCDTDGGRGNSRGGGGDQVATCCTISTACPRSSGPRRSNSLADVRGRPSEIAILPDCDCTANEFETGVVVADVIGLTRVCGADLTVVNRELCIAPGPETIGEACGLRVPTEPLVAGREFSRRGVWLACTPFGFGVGTERELLAPDAPADDFVGMIWEMRLIGFAPLRDIETRGCE